MIKKLSSRRTINLNGDFVAAHPVMNWLALLIHYCIRVSGISSGIRRSDIIIQSQVNQGFLGDGILNGHNFQARPLFWIYRSLVCFQIKNLPSNDTPFYTNFQIVTNLTNVS